MSFPDQGRDYRKDKNATKDTRRPMWDHGCDHCKGKFEDDEKFIVIDIKDQFNDEVYAYHKNCFGGALKKLNLRHA